MVHEFSRALENVRYLSSHHYEPIDDTSKLTDLLNIINPHNYRAFMDTEITEALVLSSSYRYMQQGKNS